MSCPRYLLFLLFREDVCFYKAVLSSAATETLETSSEPCSSGSNSADVIIAAAVPSVILMTVIIIIVALMRRYGSVQVSCNVVNCCISDVPIVF